METLRAPQCSNLKGFPEPHIRQSNPTHASGFQLFTMAMTGNAEEWVQLPCCRGRGGLLQSTPVCLCQLLAGGADSYGISVDYKRAMALPGVCRLNAPPLSACAENPPSATPSKSKSHAPGRLNGRGLVALAALPLAITAAAMF
uniref:Bifunctional inhibitor/plant lipid transfer protein/seed storage helical domain-containing protein n=1 Tax=Aegilops tauschii TaxID=37682 RepID=R7W675_AEGTA